MLKKVSEDSSQMANDQSVIKKKKREEFSKGLNANSWINFNYLKQQLMISQLPELIY